MPGLFRGARAVVLALMVAGCSSPVLRHPVRFVAFGDFRVRSDDARNAGHERYAEHAGG